MNTWKLQHRRELEWLSKNSRGIALDEYTYAVSEIAAWLVWAVSIYGILEYTL